MNILIVGGAGYVGCCTALEAKRRGHKVTVLDNFSNSSLGNINKAGVDSVITANAGQYQAHGKYDAVIYLAALKSVTESETQAMRYVMNNILELATFLSMNPDVLDIPFVFASSAAVYGNSDEILTTSSPIQPRNIYGMTKVIGEKLVSSLRKHRILRYFNIGGADTIGEEYGKMGNFIPRLFQSKEITVRGGNVDTTDGYPERDYIDVRDVARINIDCVEELVEPGIFNIASGVPTSTKQLVDMVGIEDYKVEPLGNEEANKLIGKGDFMLMYNINDIISSSKKWYGTNKR